MNPGHTPSNTGLWPPRSPVQSLHIGPGGPASAGFHSLPHSASVSCTGREMGPWREGLSQFTEREVNNSMCGEGPHRCQATSWGWPAFHLETLSSSPTGSASTAPESQPTRLPAVSQQRSLGLRAPQRGHKALRYLSEPGVTQRGCQMSGLGSHSLGADL